MGGLGSGRYGGHPTIERCRSLVLDVNLVTKSVRAAAAALDENKIVTTGPWRLTWTRRGEPQPWTTLGLTVELGRESGEARLDFDIEHLSRRTGPQDQRVRLETTPCHFGGHRWWWVCPATGRYCSKLYLPNGGRQFLSRGRGAYMLAYESQRTGAIDRSHGRMARLERRMGAEHRYLEDFPPDRPKWMRHRTYARPVSQWQAARDRHDDIFIMGAQRLLGRLNRFT